ncbi:MAG: MerR family transcriptional regulator [Bacteroidota bacterium]|jgi:DNA-binding transcriptional MerR regulator
MNQFTISDIETLSGIKAQTLRVWEQRYGILIPKRKKSKHRIYDNNDLKEILTIAYLNQSGFKISKIAGMSLEERNRITAINENQASLYKNYITQFIEASISFDEKKFQYIYQTIAPQIGFEKMMLHVYYPLLQQIGTYWMSNQINPAHEHFISEQISRNIDTEMQILPVVKKGSLTVLYLPEGEHHRLPLLFIKYLMRKNRKRAVYLGSDTALSVLQNYMQKNKVDKIHIHLITEFFHFQPVKYIKKLLHICKDQEIILSGPVGAYIPIENPRITKLNSLQALLNYINA